MNLSQIIIKDIKDTLNRKNMDSILEFTNKLYKESIEQLNAEAKNPDGKLRTRLTPAYAKRKSKEKKDGTGGAATGFPNFVLTGRAKKSLKGTVATSANTLDIFYHFTDDDANNYMYINEIADPYKKDRRQFPVESDSKSSRQKDTIKIVAQLIANVLTIDRKIVVPQDKKKTLVEA